MRTQLCECGEPITVYEPGDPGDYRGREPIRGRHAQVHKLRLRRYKRLGFTPRFRPHRTELVAEGMRFMKADDLQTRIRGADFLITAYFHASLGHYLDSKHLLDHPTRPEFAAQLDLEGTFPEDVASHLRSHYGPPGPGAVIDPAFGWST